MATLRPGKAHRESIIEFQRLTNLMSSMHTQFQIKPSDPSVIQIDASAESHDFVRIKCAPVVCRVPERASHGDARLYVVFEGVLDIALADDGSHITRSFATNFAYFEVGAAAVTHRLGGHYDFSTSPLGHPITHMQLRSQAIYFEHVIRQFTSVEPGLPMVDGMEHVLNQFRAPSAQVDFLGFLLQVGADHLIDGNSGDEVQMQFRALLNTCAPVSGIDRPNDGGTCKCAHSVHLYFK